MIRHTAKIVNTTFTKFTLILFLLISGYLVLPIVDVPFMGLSISAPLLFLVVLEATFRPPRPWSKEYRPFIILAVLIWAGVFLSASVNGLLSGGVDINTEGILTVIRYAYWLLIFIVVVYVVNVGNLFLVLTRVLGWSILVLALFRWSEIIIFGNYGAWSGTHFLSQNDYGMQFSAFSPFLLGLALSEKGGKKTVAVIGYILLLGAVAVNGSRGSWVSVALGVAILLMILAAAGQRSFLGLFVLLIVTGSIAFLIFSASPKISQAVESRFNTLQSLDEEKSYMIRELMNQKALRLFEQSPFFGSGAGRFRYSSVELEIPTVLQYENQAYFDRKSAHNSYLSFLAENGLVGAIPFAVLLIFLTISGWKAAMHLARQNQYWGTIFYASFIGMSVHMWVMSSLTNTSTWFIYGLLAAMIIKNQFNDKDKN
jgi:O-antigen ligase